MVTTFLLQMQKFTLPFKLLTVLIDDVLLFIAHYVVVNLILLNIDVVITINLYILYCLILKME